LPAYTQSRRCCQRSTTVLHRKHERQRRKEDRQSSLPQRRWGMLQRHARRPQGVPRGERPSRFFPRFLIVEKSGLAERPLCRVDRVERKKYTPGLAIPGLVWYT